MTVEPLKDNYQLFSQFMISPLFPTNPCLDRETRERCNLKIMCLIMSPELFFCILDRIEFRLIPFYQCIAFKLSLII